MVIERYRAGKNVSGHPTLKNRSRTRCLRMEYCSGGFTHALCTHACSFAVAVVVAVAVAPLLGRASKRFVCIPCPETAQPCHPGLAKCPDAETEPVSVLSEGIHSMPDLVIYFTYEGFSYVAFSASPCGISIHVHGASIPWVF